MSLTELRWEVLDCLGYVFCEFAFRWYDCMGDIPWHEEDWRWFHHVGCFIGGVSYSVGCFFYGLQESQ